jgi:hypothetical protein
MAPLLCIALAEPPSPAAWEELLDALDALSPLIDDAGPGLAYADMHGIGGTARQWMTCARELLAPLPCRLGIGSNKIVARAAAHRKDGTVCAPGRERALLAPMAPALLGIEPGVVERLRLLGIETLGDLAALPHGPFVRRFGPDAARWHALANGRDDAPFVPRGHAVAIEAAMYGEGRVEDEAQVLFALRMLLARVGADLERCGKRAGALSLDIELDDAQTQHFDVPLSAPTAQERAMLDVLRAKLEGTTFGAPIVGLRVRAGRLEAGGEALPLLTGDDFDPQTVAVTIARLEAALGEPVRRAHVRPAHALEERFNYDRFEAPRRTAGGSVALADVPSQATLVPQLRLLEVREVAVRLRRGEPAFVGDPPQAVLECAGPWRIELGGHPTQPVARDEYDVALADGRQCRIYRQGKRWYLRGTYD